MTGDILCGSAPLREIGLAKAQRRKEEGFKNAKFLSLAPIAVEILVSRCSARKIVTDSGTDADKNDKTFCSKIN
jgi:hypothetical protein